MGLCTPGTGPPTPQRSGGAKGPRVGHFFMFGAMA